jgi:CO dehydrogenase nickel-insertion accessory protein CooC1
MKPEHALTGHRIGVFGKGGSGKSTLVVLLAKELRRRGHDVCVVDADSTNEGLAEALGVEAPPAPLIDHFGGPVFTGGSVTCPVDDPTPLWDSIVSPENLPDRYWGRTPEGIRLLTVGKIGHRIAGAGCDGPMAKIARDLRIRVDGNAPITLLDFKAGAEDSARGVATSLDWIILSIDPSTASVRLAGDMRFAVQALRWGVVPATDHLESEDLVEIARAVYRDSCIRGMFLVLGRIPDDSTERFLRGVLREEGLAPIGAIRENPDIRAAWLRGTPLDPAPFVVDLDAIVGRIESVAKIPVDSPAPSRPATSARGPERRGESRDTTRARS